MLIFTFDFIIALSFRQGGSCKMYSVSVYWYIIFICSILEAIITISLLLKDVP